MDLLSAVRVHATRSMLGRGIFLVPILGAWACASSDADTGHAHVDEAGAGDVAVAMAVEDAADAPEVISPRIASPVCSVDGFCWEAPSPQGNDVFGVWGTSSSNLFAVGELGSLLHYDGAGWTRATWASANFFRAVWGSGPTDVWAVGDGAMIAHFDGTAWTPLDVAMPGEGGAKPNLLGIAGTSATEVWAVGDGGTIAHFDGTTWTQPPSGTTNVFRAVFATETDVFAVGEGGALAHYDGNAWTLEKNLPSATLTAVHGTSREDVWATTSSGAVLHYDGTSWSSAVVDMGVPLQTVVAESPDSVWVGGDNGDVWHYALVPFDGDGATEAGMVDGGAARTGDAGKKDAAPASDALHKWSKIATGTRAGFFGSWTSGQGDVWMVGGGGETRKWNGTSWDRLGTANNKNYLAVSGTTPQDIWIVGDEALHFSDGRWKSVSTGSDRALYAVAPLEGGWGVGTGGTIVRLGSGEGGAPMAIDSPTTQWLRGVWTTGATAGWIVGGAGTTLALLNGMAWQAVPTGGVSVDLLDVWGSAVNDVWAVGKGGTILHWRGASWALVPNGNDGGATSELRGVWGANPKDIWAVGSGGTIVHYNGAAWTASAGGETYSLNDVWGTSATDVWAVGTGGVILNWNGTSWTRQESGTNSALNAVWESANDLWVVGEGGTILRKPMVHTEQ